LPADYSADSLPDDSLGPADSVAELADSVAEAQLRRDVHSPPADCPADSADLPLVLVVPVGRCLAERRVCQPLLLPVSREEQP
jgi:hypothetical protein